MLKGAQPTTVQRRKTLAQAAKTAGITVTRPKEGGYLFSSDVQNLGQLATLLAAEDWISGYLARDRAVCFADVSPITEEARSLGSGTVWRTHARRVLVVSWTAVLILWGLLTEASWMTLGCGLLIGVILHLGLVAERRS